MFLPPPAVRAAVCGAIDLVMLAWHVYLLLTGQTSVEYQGYKVLLHYHSLEVGGGAGAQSHRTITTVTTHCALA